MDDVRDSVDAALDLDETEVYSHIAHESAEDIRRIIASIDAERAKLAGAHVYYHDDWDELIRERIRKGKRHTAFDFYNPELMSLWEMKVEELKHIKRRNMFVLSALSLVVAASFLASLLVRPMFLIGLAMLPLFYLQRTRFRIRRDLIYHELAQFFIDELAEILKKHRLDPRNYRFKIFNRDYFGVTVERTEKEVYATVGVRG
ncbi:MAG: hypothetical protein GXO14_02340 [Thermococci archaeon]|nr:hypothetical protein [Thermococci archaeon]